jgi:NUMOD4 motif
MEETRRPIPGRAGYEVSDLGRVRNIDRVIAKTWRGRTGYLPLKGRDLRLHMAAAATCSPGWAEPLRCMFHHEPG